MQEMRTKLEKDFSFMSYAPILFISAKTGQRLDQLFELIKQRGPAQRHADHHRRLQRHSGPGHRPGAAPLGQGKAAEDLLYDPGLHQAPHLCLLLQPITELFHFLLPAVPGEPRSGRPFGLEGTPIRMVIRERGDKD